MSEKAWYVIRSATRQEERAKAAILELGLDGDDVYLPVETVWRKLHHRGRKVATAPVLPGYLFVWSDVQTLAAIEALEQVYEVMRAARADGRRVPVAVPVKDIARLQAAERSGAFDFTRNRRGVRVEPGEAVRVGEDGGAYAGWVGEITKLRRSKRVEVLFRMIGATRIPPKTIEIDPNVLEPAA